MRNSLKWLKFLFKIKFLEVTSFIFAINKILAVCQFFRLQENVANKNTQLVISFYMSDISMGINSWASVNFEEQTIFVRYYIFAYEKLDKEWLKIC